MNDRKLSRPRQRRGHFSCTIMVSPRLNRTGVGDNDPTIIEPDQVA
jgi:hypothetical protein